MHVEDPACWPERVVGRQLSSLPRGAGSTHPLHSTHSPAISFFRVIETQTVWYLEKD